MSSLSKVTSKGQVTIPVHIRNQLNIQDGDQLIFETVGEYEVRIKVVKSMGVDELFGALPARGNIDPYKVREEIAETAARRVNQEGKQQDV